MQGALCATRQFRMRGLSSCALFLLFSLFFLGCGSTHSAIKRERIAEGHYQQGIVHLNEQRVQEAFVEFQKAKEIYPEHRGVHYALGHIYFMKEKDDEASREFQEALRIDPDFSEAHNYLGAVYARKGEWDKAISEFRKALKNPLYETPHAAHYNLGVLFLVVKKNPETAIQEFQEALKVDPTYVPAHNGLGIAYGLVGQWVEAIKVYREALKIRPLFFDVRYNLAVALIRQGAKGSAVKELEELIKLAPDTDNARHSQMILENIRKGKGDPLEGLPPYLIKKVET